MDKQEFDKRLNDAIVMLTKTMTEEFEKPQPYKRWRAEEGEEFAWLHSNGDVCSGNEEFCMTDNFNHATGNYFKTESEAETHKQRLLATQELKDLACGWEFKPYHANGDEYNHYIEHESHGDTFGANGNSGGCAIGTVYFSSEAKAQHAIDTLGTDKLNLIFNIKG